MTRFWTQITLLVLVMTVGLFTGLHAGTARADSNPWLGAMGYSTCGGLDPNGHLQAPCASPKKHYNGYTQEKTNGWTWATKKSNQLKHCPKGSFHVKGECYSCPAGYHRNLKPLTSARACQKLAPAIETARATFLGSGKCPAGSFFNHRNGGECWECPAGYHRTAAKIGAWNACGKFGKKAHTAYFESRACPVQGSIHVPRDGGQCWTCPANYSRTANPLTGDRACKKVFDFKPVVREIFFKCPAGQIKSGVDGGTCWTCPRDFKRSHFGIKSAKACVNKQMAWAWPKRQLFGIFGLGTGADNILAKLIADRTKINNAVITMATYTGKNKATALKNAWEVIDTKPWESPVLATLLEGAVFHAAEKPANQRTASEKDLLRHVSDLIQWDRQFIAYQAKQAYVTWIKAEKMSYDQSMRHAGAAVIYADNVYTPPNFNQTLINSLQAGTPLLTGAAYVGAVLKIPGFRKSTLPFRDRGAAQKGPVKNLINDDLEDTTQLEDSETVINAALDDAISEGLGDALSSALGTVFETVGEAVGAAGGAGAASFAVVTAAAVVVGLEIDKYGQVAKAEGQIRQAIDLANRPVVISRLLQEENGLAEFSYHWANVISLAKTAQKPSAYFLARLKACESGNCSAKPASDQIHVRGSASISAKDAAATNQLASTVVKNMVQHPAPTTSSTSGQIHTTPISSTYKTVGSTTKPQVRTATGPAPMVNTQLFHIVDATGACLQVISNHLRLGSCQARGVTRWISTEGQLKEAPKFNECLTSSPRPYMSACRKGSAAQQWHLISSTKTIVSGVRTCLEARGIKVRTANCRPLFRTKKWEAVLVK